MQFTQARHDIVRSVSHRWLVKCWGKLQSEKRVPLWKDLELQDVASVVDKLMFCDVVPENGEDNFRIRYQGKRITELYGADCRGKLLGTTMAATVKDAAMTTYRQTVTSRCPTYTVVNMHDRDNNPVSYERLLLPFSFNGQDVSRILTAIEIISTEGTIARDGMMVATRGGEYSVCATLYTVPQ